MKQQHFPTAETRAAISALVGCGVQQREIARYMGIPRTTLQRHYAEEIALGAIRANTEVAKSLFRMATDDKNVAAAIFWLKSRAGWSEKVKVETTGADGGPIQFASVDYSQLTDEELDVARRIATKVQAASAAAGSNGSGKGSGAPEPT